jgi:energy-coupling factor transporter ATP-binding protein EcfA2
MTSDSLSLQLKNLSKSFSTFRAIDDVNLEVKQGEVFGLLGPNGAGKTTTMRIISCLLKPTGGDVLVNEKSVKDPVNRVKVSRVEALLATPLSDMELLFGKTLVSFIPAMIVTFLSFSIYAGITDYLNYPMFGYAILPNSLWVVILFRNSSRFRNRCYESHRYHINSSFRHKRGTAD